MGKLMTMETLSNKSDDVSEDLQLEHSKPGATTDDTPSVEHDVSNCSQYVNSSMEETVCGRTGTVADNSFSPKPEFSAEVCVSIKPESTCKNAEQEMSSNQLSLNAKSFGCSDKQESSEPLNGKTLSGSDSAEDKENNAAELADKEPSLYDNPIFRELSRINGEINKLRIDQLKSRLRAFRLDTYGKKTVLQKRLKTYYRNQKLGEDNLDNRDIFQNRYYEYYLVIDFEATCDEADPHKYRHEIIEFPAILVSTKKCQVIREFHTYVHPTVNPKLTSFCTELTGITQDKVNFAPIFPEVLQKFEEWLEENKLTTKPDKFAVVTDGPWDMGRFLFQQCLMSNVPYPSWAVKWINIRKNYSNFYSTKKMCLKEMLKNLGMKFEGQPHCGLDDSRNIARVAIKLLQDGANMRVNERIHLRKDGNYDPRDRVVRNISRNNFNGMKKKLLSSDKFKDVEGAECDDDLSTDTESVKLWVDPSDKNEFPDLIPQPHITPF